MSKKTHINKADFERWCGGIELSLVKWMEQVHKISYWTARDVAMDIVKKQKGLRDLYRQGLTSSQAAGRIGAALGEKE